MKSKLLITNLLVLFLFISVKNFGQCVTVPAFGPGAITESFEGIPTGPNNPAQFGGYTVPVTPFTFSSGVILSAPFPNSFSQAVLGDWAKGDASWGFCTSTTTPADVPGGTAQLGINNTTDVLSFTLPFLAEKVGLYVEGGCSAILITLRAYDASNNLIGTCTTAPTGIAGNWKTHFLGFNSPAGNIKRIEVSGPYLVVDLLTFESACVPFSMDPVANQTVCNNANTAAVIFSGAPAGAEYNWTNDQTSIGLAASGSGNIASFIATNTGTVPAVSTITVTPVTVSNIYYIRNVNPWGLTLNDDAMNAVFGASNWTAANYGVNPATVFSGGTRFVFIEGSDNNANAMNAFITANITTIENWVSAGGRLFMNAAPNEGGSMNWGFGGVNCVYPAYSSNVTAAVPAHPVYLGPFTPVATAFSGTSYTHANLTGGGLTNLMNGDSPGSVMGSLNWGSGFVMFATRTTTNFHTPSAESQNLLQNIISYTADMSGATNCTGTPINFTITVNPTPTVNAVPDQVVCNGAPTTAVNFSGNTTGIICATANEGNNLTLTAPAGMVFTSILFASYGTPNGACGSFTIGGCHAANSMAIVSGLAIGQNSVTIPATNAQFGDPCFGTGKRLYVEAVYSAAGTTAYNWTNNTTSIGLAAAGSGNIASFTATNITNAPVVATVTVTPTYTNAGVSCDGTAITFTITVNPTPTVNAQANQTVCVGTTTTATFTGTVSGTVYNWTNTNTNIGLGANGIGDISFTSTNATAVPITGTITVTPAYTNGGTTCTGTPVSFTITVNPTPTVNAQPNQTVCVGTTTTATFTGSVSGTVYNWTNTNTNIGLGANGTGDISFTSTNATAVPITGTITVTPAYTNGGTTCTGTPVSFTITVNPTPTVNAQPNQTVCVGTTTTATFTGAVAGTIYNWTNTNTNIGLGASGTGDISFTSTNATLVPITGTITVTPAYTNGGTTCTGTPVSFTITVNPTPTVNAVPNQSICPGALTAPVTFTGAIAGTVFNWTNNNTSIGLGASGTGNIAAFIGVNPGTLPNVGTITVTPTYTTGGVSCSGTPITFTITVTPNPSLVIVADPGTTICEGDPTLLTVRIGTSSPIGTLYNQSGAQVNGSPSQVFEPANAGFNSQSADDFTVPAGATWTITQVTANGIGTGNPTSVNVFFYANSASNLPGAAVASYTNIATFVRTGSNYNVTLPAALNIAGGTYWVSIQVNMSFATGGQWFWANFGTTNIGSQYAWQNPGGGFGTPCPAWGYGSTGCNVGGGVARNNIFSIIGSSLVDGGPLPGGYTFLWSPAAGLSSTTSNPVAASPMNTTTYTVVATTGAGCTRTASILITVNKRPTVTAQPLSRANCEGTAATFTVAGTGTALTYQWQVSTTGIGGPWVNLANTAPYSNVTTATLTVNPVTLAMNGYAYRCVLSGSCAPILTNNISNPAVLTVNPNPAVTVTPASGCGGVAGINGLLLTASGANSYTWSPLAGLYTNAIATIPYTGGNTATVYAAPTAFTAYTVTGTLSTTGCFSTATAFINYTPPAPTVVPSSVTMCLGDPAVKLKSSSSQSFSSTFNSGTLALAIPDGPATWPQTVFPGVVTPNLPVSGIPASAVITGMSVKLNLTHTYIADMVIVLKAPNGQVFNLDANINKTGGPGANFINTVISSASTTPLSAGAPPYTGTFQADAAGATYVAAGFTFPGGPTSPAGYIPTVTNFNGLYSVPNGNWTLGMYDWGFGDLGTLTNWELKIDYATGVPATPAVWSPAAGLFSDALATVPYVAGTAVDSVWTRPTPSGVYPYQVTVQSLPTPPATPATTYPAGNGNSTITFNVRNNNAYPVTLSTIDSRTFAAGATNVSAYFKPSAINGAPGAISAANGWNQFGTASITGTGTGVQPFMTGLTLVIPAGATYGICIEALTPTAGFNLSYSNTTTPIIHSSGGCDIISGPNVGYGGVNVPAAPTFTPRGFIGSVGLVANFAACTSPARTVIVTVNAPTTVATQPVNQTICTDNVATFSVTASGSGPFSYQWQVSTNTGNTWANITNGGVYSGATTATLTITAPPVSMSGYQYRVIINGAAPCASATSFKAILTVNPLPVIVISASPYTSLFPGLTTTISSTVTPVAANTYTWLRNGVVVAGAVTGTITVDIDGLGDYQLRVNDLNGCSNVSNIITIKDSVNAKCFIYPNPTSGKFQVRYHSAANNVLPRTLTIYDTKGDRVFTQFYTIGRPYDRMDVDMRAYGKGLYWVEIGDLNGNRLAMCRVVIQ